MNLARSVIVAGTCIAGLGAAPPALATVTFAAPARPRGRLGPGVGRSRRLQAGQVQARPGACQGRRAHDLPPPAQGGAEAELGRPAARFPRCGAGAARPGASRPPGTAPAHARKARGRPGAAARRGIRVLRRVTPKVLARLDALGERGRASARRQGERRLLRRSLHQVQRELWRGGREPDARKQAPARRWGSPSAATGSSRSSIWPRPATASTCPHARPLTACSRARTRSGSSPRSRSFTAPTSCRRPALRWRTG